MKNILVVTLLVVTTALHAQFTKGIKFIEVGSSSNDLRVSPTGFMFYISDEKERSIVIGLSGGYFISDGLALKLGSGFSYSKLRDLDALKSYGVSGGIEYYISNKFPVELRYSASFRDQYKDSHFLTLKVGYAKIFDKKFVLKPFAFIEKSLNNYYANGAGIGVSFSYNFK
ncbi:hypothetical protein HZP59_08750 [Elizabethkingia anophelis]|nr:hypothetical protein [Elizabethkingia anophelis]